MATSRAATNARTQILAELKEDHKRVKKAYKDFQKLDPEQDSEACAAIVEMVLDELTVHAALEEELLYPAAHRQIADESLVDEAEVEHESVHALIEQLRGMQPGGDKYAARFTVLCEYVLHHVKEEEGEMFPQLEKAKLDWQGLAQQMAQRREELTSAAEEEEQEDGRKTAATEPAETVTGNEDDKATLGADQPKQAIAVGEDAPPAKRSGSTRRSSAAKR
ncbi:MAG: hemerythrin domain-containing protein [Rubrivivax sp.]|nr:hemerythrin domain-containing protein [Rubrivivax sp.]